MIHSIDLFNLTGNNGLFFTVSSLKVDTAKNQRAKEV